MRLGIFGRAASSTESRRMSLGNHIGADCLSLEVNGQSPNDVIDVGRKVFGPGAGLRASPKLAASIAEHVGIVKGMTGVGELVLGE